MIKQNQKTVKILMLLGQDFLRPKIDPRVYKEAKSLIKAGIEVNIISLSSHGPLSQNYENINLQILADQINLPALRDKAIFYYWPKIIFGLFGNLKNVMAEAKKIDYQIIHCNDADTLFFGLALKFTHRKKVKLIYDSHEIATEMASFKSFKPVIGLIEWIASFHTDGFITINDSAKKFILKKYPRFSQNCQIIKNVPRVLINLKEKEVKKPINFLYQGNLKKDRQGIFSQIIEIFKTLDPKLWTLTLLVEKADLSDFGLQNSNSIFVKKCIIDPLEFQKELNHYDVGIIAMDNICLNNYFSLPNKLFDYMTAGVAVLGPNYPEIAKVVKEAKNGFLFKDENELKIIIDFILANPAQITTAKKNGLSAVTQNYNWSIEEEKLIRFYQNIA